MKRLVVGLIAVFVVVVGGLVVVIGGVIARDSAVTNEMLTFADSIDIPAEWEQYEEIVRPEMTICLDTNPCPSLVRSWRTGTQLTAEALLKLGNSAGHAVQVNHECDRPSNTSGRFPVCQAVVENAEYSAAFNVMSPGEGEHHEVTLDLRPINPKLSRSRIEFFS